MTFSEFIVKLRPVLPVPLPEAVTPDDSLYDDLGFDSIQAFELLIIVESLADSMAILPEMPELYTLADAYQYFERLKLAEAELFSY